MWLGRRRGYLIDWLTQVWVAWTGRRILRSDVPWLDGPIGRTDTIGLDYFESWAATTGDRVTRHDRGAGLLRSFASLTGPTFPAEAVDRSVVAFYEQTADYEIDVWSQWSLWFRPFGWLVSVLFSRRLKQLNLPLASLDTSWGMSSTIVEVADVRTKTLKATGWFRTLLKTKRITYVGCYSISPLPGSDSPCVKTLFPLPNGNAIVLLRPHCQPDGSLMLVSAGRRLGDPGFYFTIHHDDGTLTARYLRCFREQIHVFPAERGFVRADHTMTLFGLTCLQLHYRMRRIAPA